MRVLVLGATGMLGHQMCRVLCRQFDVWATVRRPSLDLDLAWVIAASRLLPGVAVEKFTLVAKTLDEVRPEVVINCVGDVGFRASLGKTATPRECARSIQVNALFPQQMADMAATSGFRFIHVSTDCVFTGSRGQYAETDPPDGQDLYGRTKVLGEVDTPECLTVRTSMIGHSLLGDSGLVDWFLSNDGGCVEGFTRSVFSGLTTRALATIVAEIVSDHPTLNGLYHVSSEPISKCELLGLVHANYECDIQIDPTDRVRVDRSLDSSRFRQATGFVPQSWTQMVAEMSEQYPAYQRFRRDHASS